MPFLKKSQRAFMKSQTPKAFALKTPRGKKIVELAKKKMPPLPKLNS